MSSMYLRSVPTLALLAGLVAGCSASDEPEVATTRRAVEFFPPQHEYAVYASNSLYLEDNARIDGHAGVTGEGPVGQYDVLADGVRASIGAWADVGYTTSSEFFAETAFLRFGSDVYRAWIDQVFLDQHHNGFVINNGFETMPRFPRARPVIPGTSHLTVATSTTIQPGAYDRLEVLSGVTVDLAAGTYDVAELVVGDNAALQVQGGVELRVAERLLTGSGITFAVASGLSAQHFRVEVLGRNGGLGGPQDTPFAATFGTGSTLRAIVFAPNGTLDLGGGTVTGALLARDVWLGNAVHVGYEDGLLPLPGVAPLAFDDSFGATEDQPLAVASEGVLANDLDPNYEAITASLVQPTTNGTVALAADGGFTYTPNPNFSGTDIFTYVASDGTNTSSTATVVITVEGTNDVPVVLSAPAPTAFVGQRWRYTPLVYDPDEGDTHTYSLLQEPTGVSVSTSGEITWMPSATQLGTQQFNFVVTDAAGASDTHHISVTVAATPATAGFTLYASKSLWMQLGSISIDGHVGVSGETNGVYLDTAARAVIDYWAKVGLVPGADIFAETVEVRANAAVHDIYAGAAPVVDATATMGVYSGLPSLPSFPTTTPVFAGTTTVTVAGGAQVTESVGTARAAYDIGPGGCLFLEEGTHEVGSITIADGGCLAALGSVEIRVAGRLTLGADGYIGPAEGADLGTHEIGLEVNGTNSAPNDPLSSPAFSTGSNSSIAATVVVPNGTADFGAFSVNWGTYSAQDLTTRDTALFFLGEELPVNSPPLIVSHPLTQTLEDETWTYGLQVSDADTGDTFTVTATLPSGMTMDGDGVLTWTPDNAAAHSSGNPHLVQIRVTDAAGAQDTQTFALTVVNVNDAPVFGAAPASPVEDEVYDVPVDLTDIDEGDTLSLEVLAGPSGLTAVGTRLVWDSPTQADVDAGLHAVTLRAVDTANESVTVAYELYVTSRDDLPQIHSTASTSATQGVEYHYQVDASDEETARGDLQWNLSVHPPEMRIDGTGRITWTPDNDDFLTSPHQVTVVVSDSASQTAQETFLIAVANVNDPPEFVWEPVTTVQEEGVYQDTVVAVDPDGDAIDYSLVTGPSGLTVDAQSGALYWELGLDLVGPFEVTVAASDAQTETTRTFTVDVQNVNDAPVFDHAETPSPTTEEGGRWGFSASASDPDPEDRLTFEVSGPSGIGIDALSGVATWRPTFTQAGAHSVTLTVRDIAGATDTWTFTVDVANSNQPPQFLNAPAATVAQGEQFYFPAMVDDADLPNGDRLHFTLDYAPTLASIDADTGYLTWIPDSRDLGDFAFAIRVEDSSFAFDVLPFTVTVTEVNDAPEFVSDPQLTAAENIEYRYPARAVDPEGDSVTYSLVSGPAGLRVNAETGLVTWVPATNQVPASPHQVVIRASDGVASADQTFPVSITGAVACTGTDVSARCSALGWAYALDDLGRPLGGVTVVETTPSSDTVSRSTAPDTGLVTLGGEVGAYRWLFSADGFADVEVAGTLVDDAVTRVAPPRMAALDDMTADFTAAETRASDVDGRVELIFPPGSATLPAELRAAVLDGQSLPGRLPLGWSPAGALWYEVNNAVQTPPSARFVLPAPTNLADVVLAEWSPTSHEWVALAIVSVLNATAPNPEATVQLGAEHGYALLVRDEGTGQPPLPTIGSALGGSMAAVPDAQALSFQGRATPEYQVLSNRLEDMTALARVWTEPATLPPSGIELPARTRESYAFHEGGRLDVPTSDMGVVLYRYPQASQLGSPSLLAEFRIAPRFVFGTERLADVHQRVEVRDSLAFSGAPLDPTGGSLALGNVALNFPANALTGPALVSMDEVSVSAAGLDGANVAAAFRLEWSGEDLVPGAYLGASFTGLDADASYVLALRDVRDGHAGWLPVERFITDTSSVPSSLDSGQSPRLPGLRAGGTYALIEVPTNQGIVQGSVTDGTNLLPGAVVTVEGTAWSAVTESTGAYMLLGNPTSVTARAVSLTSSSFGTASGGLADAASNVVLDIVVEDQPLSVAGTTPGSDATDVSPLTVVEVDFSEPLDPSSVSQAAIQATYDLSGTSTVVVGSIALSVDRRQLRFVPERPLPFDEQILVSVAPTMVAADGDELSSPHTFSFNTRAYEPLATGAARLLAYAPGTPVTPCNDPYPTSDLPSYFSDPTDSAAGFAGFDPTDLDHVCLVGTRGLAEAGRRVTLVNEDRGFTTTVEAGANGSFKAFLRASEEDLVVAFFENQNGTRVQVPLERQLFADGRVGLYASGGVVQAANPLAGDEPFQLIVEPGSIARRGVFSLNGQHPTQVDAFADQVAPESGTVLAGALLTYEGDELRSSVDVRFPLAESELALPSGTSATEQGYMLTRVRSLDVAGEVQTVFEVLDRMEYEDSGLATHSYPSPGVGLAHTFATGSHVAFREGAFMLAAVTSAARPTVVSGYAFACRETSRPGETPNTAPDQLAGCLRINQDRHQLPTGRGVTQGLPSGVRRLPGTVVWAVPFNGSQTYRPGVPNSGAYVGVADADARYALSIPLLGQQAMQIRGVHGEFTGRPAQATVSQASVLERTANLFFHEADRDDPALADVPRTTMTVLNAPSGSDHTITVITANSGRIPERSVVQEVSAVPVDGQGAQPTVVITETGDVVRTGNRVREMTFRVESSVPARVTYGLDLASGAAFAEQYLTLDHGTAPALNPGSIDTPDPSDQVPPYVLTSIPTEGSLHDPRDPIVLRFSEPITTRGNGPSVFGGSIVVDGGIHSTGAGFTVELSPDQRELTIRHPDLASSTRHTLQVAGGLYDLSGNEVDQDARALGIQPFVLDFRTMPIEERTLSTDVDELGRGGGSVVHGGYAYVLDRGGQRTRTVNAGKIQVFDISNPLAPSHVSTILLPNGYPRALVLIPGYSYMRPTGLPTQAGCDAGRGERAVVSPIPLFPSACVAEDRDLLGVVTGFAGSVGASTSRNGQFLTLLDVTGPFQSASGASAPPASRIVTTAPISLDPNASVDSLRWSPPYLTYLERSGTTLVSVVDLQAFIIGADLTSEQFALLPSADRTIPGLDSNSDGDFVDQNEIPPLPPRPIAGFVPNLVSGRDVWLAPSETDQVLTDYVFDGPTFFVGTALTPGLVYDTSTTPEQTQHDGHTYRTLVEDFTGVPPPRQAASVELTDPGIVRMDAMFYLPNQAIRQRTTPTEQADPHGGSVTARDLVVLAARTSDPEHPNRLYLVDVSVRAQPSLFGIPGGVELPATNVGRIRSIERVRFDDDRLRLIGAEGAMDLDIQRLTMARVPAQPHPSVLGIRAGAGPGSIDAGGRNHGVVVDSGLKSVRFKGPTMSFVTFGAAQGNQMGGDASQVVSPRSWTGRTRRQLDEIFSSMQHETHLMPGRLESPPEGVVQSTLLSGAQGALSGFRADQPRATDTHYYVLIDAPGASGDHIDVMVETLNDVGEPEPNPCGDFAPARAASASALQDLELAPSSVSPAIEPLRATRVSDDKASPYYNVYVSDPVALVYERVPRADLSGLRQLNGQPRQVLFSSHGIRVSLDPTMATNPILGPWSSRVVDGKLKLGSTGRAETYPSHRIVGPNPPPPTGAAKAPGTGGAVALHSGEIRMSATDMALPGRRLPVVFSRHYTGQDLINGRFGPGWDFDYNQRLVALDSRVIDPGMPVPVVLRGSAGLDVIARTNDVLFHDGAGHTVRYRRYTPPAPPDPSSPIPPVGAAPGVPPDYQDDPFFDQAWRDAIVDWYLPEAGIYDALVRLETGGFVRVTPSGTEFWYGDTGRLDKIHHRYRANWTSLTYTTRGELREIRDHSDVGDSRRLLIGYYRPRRTPTGSLLAVQAGTEQIVNPDVVLTGLDHHAPDPHAIGKIATLYYDATRTIRYHYDLGRLERVEGIDVQNPGVGGTAGRRLTEYVFQDNSCQIASVSNQDPVTNAQLPMFTAAQVDANGRVQSGSGYQGSFTITSAVQRASDLAAASAQIQVDTADQSASVYTLNAYGLPRTVERSNPNGAAERREYRYQDGILPTGVTEPNGSERDVEFHLEPHRLRARGNIRHIRYTGASGGLLAREVTNYEYTYNIPRNQSDFEGRSIVHTLTPDDRDIEIITVGGLTKTFARNGYGQLLSVTDFDGTTAGWGYDPATGFATYSDDGAYRTTYDYTGSCRGDAWGQPCQVISPESAIIPVQRLAYSEAGDVISHRQGAGLEERVTTVGYDINGYPARVVERVDSDPVEEKIEALSYDSGGFLHRRSLEGVDTAQAAGASASQTLTWRYFPDSFRRLQRVEGPRSDSDNWYYEYDGFGRTTLAVQGASLGSGHRTQYLYHSTGNLWRVVQGEWMEERYYDEHNRLQRVLDPYGTETTISYSPNGYQTSITTTDSSLTSGLRTLRDFAMTAHDALGRPLIWTEGGSNFSATYHPVNPLEVVTALPRGGERRVRYDTRGRVEFDSLQLSTGGPTVYQNTTVYDAAGLVFEERQEEGDGLTNYGQFTYRTSLGHVREVRDATNAALVRFEPRLDGSVVSTTVDPGGLDLVTLTPRSVLGEVLAQQEPSGVVTAYAFDEHRRPAQVGLTTARRSMSYDEQGRLTSLTLRDGVTQFGFSSFDARRRPQLTTFPDGTTSAGYDRLGRLNLQTTTYTPAAPATGTYTDTQSFTYDGFGRTRVADETTASVRLEFDFDTLGVRTAQRLEVGTFRPLRLSVTPYPDGTPNQTTYGSGTVIVDSRDQAGRLTAQSVRGQARITQQTFATAQAAEDTTYVGASSTQIVRHDVYDARRRLLERRYDVGGVSRVDLRYAYDGANRETARQYVHRAGRADLFSYDADSRLVQAALATRPATAGDLSAPPTAPAVDPSWRPRDRIQSFTFSGTSDDQLTELRTWTGERPAAPGASTLMSQSSGNAMGFVDSVGGQTRAHDNLWNTTSLVTTAGALAIEYDGASRARRVLRPDGAEVTYTYRADGLLARRTVTGCGSYDPNCVNADEVYVFDGLLLREVYDGGSGQLLAQYFYADEGEVPYAAEFWSSEANQMQWYFLPCDRQGSIIGVLDEAGNWVERVDYDPYGQPYVRPADAFSPTVRAAAEVSGTDEILVAFSEPVFGYLTMGGAANGVQSSANALQGFTVEDSLGNAVPVSSAVLDEAVSGWAAGSVVRVRLGASFDPNETYSVHVASGAVQDDWGNTSVGTAAGGVAVGVTLGSEVPTTVSAVLTRSTVGNRLLFQSHLWDADVGLYHMKARMFDAGTGLFLQTDPAGYKDSVQLYAGFRWDPINVRDPTGEAGHLVAGAAIGAGFGFAFDVARQAAEIMDDPSKGISDFSVSRAAKATVKGGAVGFTVALCPQCGVALAVAGGAAGAVSAKREYEAGNRYTATVDAAGAVLAVAGGRALRIRQEGRAPRSTAKQPTKPKRGETVYEEAETPERAFTTQQQEPPTPNGGKTRQRELREVSPRELRPTHPPDSKSKVQKMGKKIKKEGFKEEHPVEAIEIEGKLYIQDGHHRTAGAIKARVPKIPVVVKQPDKGQDTAGIVIDWIRTIAGDDRGF